MKKEFISPESNWKRLNVCSVEPVDAISSAKSPLAVTFQEYLIKGNRPKIIEIAAQIAIIFFLMNSFLIGILLRF